MNAKHTTGPWSATKGSAAGHVVITSTVTPVDVCVMSKRGKSKEEIEANIDLVTAAPELLYAAQLSLACMEKFIHLENEFANHAKKVASAAIAKATGEQA